MNCIATGEDLWSWPCALLQAYRIKNIKKKKIGIFCQTILLFLIRLYPHSCSITTIHKNWICFCVDFGTKVQAYLLFLFVAQYLKFPNYILTYISSRWPKAYSIYTSNSIIQFFPPCSREVLSLFMEFFRFCVVFWCRNCAERPAGAKY